MAQLSSPGVSVTVIDESFYTPAAPGTVPLIIVASQANKQNSSGTGIAPGTVPANAGKVYLLTSQMDLGNTFGIPYFQTDAENNPVHAGELNEYGLQAAYSFLGVSGRAYVVRADIDTKQLIGSANPPTAAPADGTFWFDTTDTAFGVFEWNANVATATNGQTFSVKPVTVITNSSLLVSGTPGNAPLTSVGTVGSYALVATTTLNKLYFKKALTDTAAGTWVEVGSTAWSASWPTAVGSVPNPTLTATGTTFTGYIAGTTLTVTSGSGVAAGEVLSGAGVTPGTEILSQLGGTAGGAGTYRVSASQTAGSSGSPISITTGGSVLNISVNGGSAQVVTGVSSVTALATAINTLSITGVTAAAINGYLNIYSTGATVTLTGSAGTACGFATNVYYAPALTQSAHYNVPTYAATDWPTSANGYPSGSIWIKTTAVNQGANFFVKEYSADINSWVKVPAPLYASNAAALAALDPTGGGINLTANTVYVKYNDDEQTPPLADFKIYYRASAGLNIVTSSPITNSTFTSSTSYTFTISETQTGTSALTNAVSVAFTGTGIGLTDAQNLVAQLDAALNGTNVSASVNSNGSISITHNGGGDIQFVDGTNTPLSKLFTAGTTQNYYANPTGTGTVATLWATMMGTSAFATASATPITTTPANGTYWYDSYLNDVDIMINNGSTWVGYRSIDAGSAKGGKSINNPLGTWGTTDANGPIISASMPKVQSTGGALANGDIWINTGDIENYPEMYKFNFTTQKWVQIDVTDQVTGNGIVFGDARWSDQSGNSVAQSGLGAPDTIQALLTSNFVDFDAPDPALYAKGTLLWNTRRSGFNVKKYEVGYVDVTSTNPRLSNGTMAYYFPDRWVSAAPNDYRGVGQFGRHAQRAVVLQAIEATIQSNQNIRQPDTVIFNLLSCPGYLETLSSLIGLNTDNGQTAFVVADTPARLTPDATSLSNWGNNSAGAVQDGDVGLIATDAYSAVYYPWGYTSDLHGNNIVVPPSYIMLRTIALSDNVSYPWFAPAGVRRGGVTNASSVGYVNATTGEFNTVALNVGQRDTLAGVHVNPITYIAGTGLVVYGQKTRQLVASSLDRINVARLVIYLRYQLNALAKPFIFEPNDTITRNEIKQQIEKLLLELTGQRALYDFLVVCDTSNNTPARIDRNELHVDIAIEPVKAVEFIYIPLRLENTGGIKGLAGA